MSNQLIALLTQWQSQKQQTSWVLGTIYRTQGPCYRKAGAMMMFGGDGQQLGMLSGGCLESDIQQHARRVMLSNQSSTISYDASDEDDLAFQLGIGCGGIVHIVLQPIDNSNNYQYLEQLLVHLQQRQPCVYQVQLPLDDSNTTQNTLLNHHTLPNTASLIQQPPHQWLHIPIHPAPHLLVVGGGLDARPLVAIAGQLGWQISLYDPRPANARSQYFPAAHHIFKGASQQLTEFCQQTPVDAAVLMSHNINLDAKALQVIIDHPQLRYLALLGPAQRRATVFAQAQVCLDHHKNLTISGPAGLDLGGELPESIALSILAECHACLFNASGLSLGKLSA